MSTSSSLSSSFSFPSLSSSSPPSSPLPLSPSSAASVASGHWLALNGFSQELCTKLREYTFADLNALTKADAVTLCGAVDGIRLWNRIQPHSTSPARHSAVAIRIRVSSMASPSPSLRAGMCSEEGCRSQRTLQCSAIGCFQRICPRHTNKSLLSGAVYCRYCAINHIVGSRCNIM